LALREIGGSPEAILFDWDNTLVDTWSVIQDAMNVTLVHMGLPPWSMAETRLRVRKALREAFPEMFGDDWKEARDIFYERFNKIHLDRLAIKTGAEDTLLMLKGENIPIGVVSNKSGDNLRNEVFHLGWNHYFGAVIGASDATRDKPERDPVDLAIEQIGIRPDACIWFVGDTDVDVECAVNSDCLAVLISDDLDSAISSCRYKPDLVFDNLNSLKDLVYNRLNSLC
jgi:phosphoglycolate phosphatase